ncbi:hypothetical protein A3F97_03205 [Candidatus Nomurabacteria bacterium RIFCSPLOWO2_12_FULL_41_10]|uniref:Uncharacterized protein n=1 Tax=Candidatus Nomurabacteria bacterium RIFCSPLOWO2_12_FULL_41_10 TaxID=1801795 RepID=A0A1F6YCH8_9BACT|nr:MAG: hypothetical protein A3F97_03205 [Candidatus Nomurabacteria bacterium RIFCSPLOWO2_12_FULL_41_10]
METKQCQNCQKDFKIEPEDFAFYEKINVPPPTWCPVCRMIRKMNWRNERSLQNRTCDLCGLNIVAMYSEKISVKVFCNKCWFSDEWNPKNYGMQYRFDLPFFEQFRNLYLLVPEINLWKIRTNVGSNYINYAADNKNCYLSYSVVSCENVGYSYSVDKDLDCYDSLSLRNSQLCYENIDGVNNHRSFFLIKCRECINSAFLFDCLNCQDCFLSSNLRNKKYVFENMQYSKEEYFRKLEDMSFGDFTTLSVLKDRFHNIILKKSLHKFTNIIKSTNSTGNNITNSRDVRSSFEIYDSENLKYCYRVLAGAKDNYDDLGLGAGSQCVYECASPGFGSYMSSFSVLIDAGQNVYYSYNCHGSNNLFACIGLRNKSYCILNKQYTKEEYESLVPKIIKHMNDMPYIDKKGRVYRYGEFFPPELSPFSYNETIAQEYFPLTKEEALNQGYSWKDPEPRNYQITLKNEDIPDHIKDVPDSILNEIIECAHNVESSTFDNALGGLTTKCNEQCTEAFRIIPSELDFLRKQNLPIPRLCPNCRHYQRIKQRNPLKLWHRSCNCRGKYGISESGIKNQPASPAGRESSIKYQNTITHEHGDSSCPNEFETSYATERPEIVYCGQCYLKEVV